MTRMSSSTDPQWGKWGQYVTSKGWGFAQVPEWYIMRRCPVTAPCALAGSWPFSSRQEAGSSL